jgi:hypothetical protein
MIPEFCWEQSGGRQYHSKREWRAGSDASLLNPSYLGDGDLENTVRDQPGHRVSDTLSQQIS